MFEFYTPFSFFLAYLGIFVGPSEVPLSEVVDAWEIYVAKGGAHTGHLERPPHQLLQEIFGSTKFEDIFSFMAEHGHLDECPRHGDLEGHEKG